MGVISGESETVLCLLVEVDSVAIALVCGVGLVWSGELGTSSLLSLWLVKEGFTSLISTCGMRLVW